MLLRAAAGLECPGPRVGKALAGGKITSRPQRCRLPRPPAAAAGGPSAAVDIETHGDGTVTFHFGVAESREQGAAAEHAASEPAVSADAAACASADAVAVAAAEAAASEPAAADATEVQPTAAAGQEAAEQLEEIYQNPSVQHPVMPYPSPSGSAAVPPADSTAMLGLDIAPSSVALDIPAPVVVNFTQASSLANGNGNGSGHGPSSCGSNGAAVASSSSLVAAEEHGQQLQQVQQVRRQRQQQEEEDEEDEQQQQQGISRGPMQAVDARELDVRTANAVAVLQVYNACCRERRLEDALHVIKECIQGKRSDVLRMLQHKWFLRPAAQMKAVKQALRFVQLLPRQYTDKRTYNMLLTVCAEAGDLKNALHCADMLQAAGFKMDTILYTNLIKACAVAGDADQAFRLYQEMRQERVPVCKQVYTTVIKACSEQIVRRSGPADRRGQLVLLERALTLVDDMKSLKVQTDAAVWNSLVAAAGRAGQPDRAFQMVEEMLTQGCRPNERTYWLLVDACAQAGDKALALRVYKKARREGCANSIFLYAATVSACLRANDGCDVQSAMAIYSDLQLAHVEPDSRFFGLLMTVAGRGGDLRLVQQLQGEMEQEGLQPCRESDSALVEALLADGQLAAATDLYRSLRAEGRWPAHYALNALLQAHAKAFRLGDVVTLVCDVVENGGLKPDRYTFAAILSACCRANEAEIALDVARVMKRRGVALDEVTAFLLLRVCYDRLRQSWTPAGYPPRPPSDHSVGAHEGGMGPAQREALRQKLLAALSQRGQEVEPPLCAGREVPWLAQAFGVYREAVGAGVKPSMRMLNQVLMCLRVQWETPAARAAAELSAVGGATGLSAVERNRQQGKIGVEGIYHAQAVSIMEEAIVSGMLPTFSLDSEAPIDLRPLPPAVAEAYVLTVVAALQRHVQVRRVQHSTHLTLLVPPYDPSKVFFPSYAQQRAATPDSAGGPAEFDWAAASAHAANMYSHSFDDEDEDDRNAYSFTAADDAFARASAGSTGGGDTRTGLGVAGVLRRLRLWGQEVADEGVIVLEAREITRWCKVTQSAADRRSTSALPVQKPYGQAQKQGLAQQQRNIRMGL